MATTSEKVLKIHTYPSGSYLLHTSSKKLKTTPMSPTTWDVDVNIADSLVEERNAQSANDSMATSKLKATISSLQCKATLPRTINLTNLESKYKRNSLKLQVIMTC